MRRLLLLPVFAIALACGGGGVFDNGHTESYPHTKNLSIDLQNTSAGDAEMWVEPDPQAGSTVAAGTTTTQSRSVTWNNSSEVVTFKFHAFKAGLSRPANATLTIDGHESHADNFSGFIAVWNGTTLSVSTK